MIEEDDAFIEDCLKRVERVLREAKSRGNEVRLRVRTLDEVDEEKFREACWNYGCVNRGYLAITLEVCPTSLSPEKV
jgi:hypothetical protein